jgi:hypothetical protein
MESRMRRIWMRATAITIVMAGLVAGAWAQNGNTTSMSAEGRLSLDYSASFFKTFSTGTTGNGTVQTPVDAYGGTIGARYTHSPFIGFELTYSLSNLDQMFATDPRTCTYTCENQPLTIPSKMNEIGMDWVVSKTSGKVTPFGVGGLGFVISTAGGDYYSLNTIVRVGYIYGGGLDWGTPRFGLRAQYRGTFYRAPNLTPTYYPTGKFTQTAQPMLGIYYRR